MWSSNYFLNKAALRTIKTIVGHADLTDADTEQDINLSDLIGEKEKVVGVTIKHATAFSGGSVSALTVSVGTASNPTAYAPEFDIFQAVGDTVFLDVTGWHSQTMAAAGHLPILRFKSVGDNLVNLTAGEVTVWVATTLLS